MAMNDSLTVAEALAQAQLIDASLAAWEETAPRFVASLGGRDALARHSEMTCVGPVPRLDIDAWQGACTEWWERRLSETSPYAAPRVVNVAAPAADAPSEPAAAPAPRKSGWRIWSR